MTKRFGLLTSLLVVLLISLTACGGESSVAKEPANQRLAAAKTALDTTSGVNISLAAKSLPTSAKGVLAAQGFGNHQPAFSGTITVFDNGLSLKEPVVAVDNQTYIKFGTGNGPDTWLDVQPSQYNAPNPAALLNPVGGLSSILTALKGVTAGKEQRQGSARVTAFTGTLAGAVIARIIPSALAKKQFSATFTLDDKNHLTMAVITGPFFPKTPDVTYTLTFTGYGTSQTIKKPSGIKKL